MYVVAHVYNCTVCCNLNLCSSEYNPSLTCSSSDLPLVCVCVCVYVCVCVRERERERVYEITFCLSLQILKIIRPQ